MADGSLRRSAQRIFMEMKESDDYPETVWQPTRVCLNDFDASRTAKEAEQAQVTWIKPLAAMLGFGLPALGLLSFAVFGVALTESLGWPLDQRTAVPWLRLIALVLGSMCLIYAMPARIHKEFVPDDPNEAPLSPDAWKPGPASGPGAGISPAPGSSPASLPLQQPCPRGHGRRPG